MTPNHKSVGTTKQEFVPLETPPESMLPDFKKWRSWFDRLGWDILGVLLVALALITFLGLLSLSQGKLVKNWVDFLQLWLGWGSYLLTVGLGWCGYLFLRKRSSSFKGIPIKKIVLAEFALLLLLAFLSSLGGHSLARASIGLDGGQIGWGMVELVSSVIPIAVVAVLSGIGIFFCLLSLFGLSGKVASLLQDWAEKVLSEPDLNSSGEQDQFDGAQLEKPVELQEEAVDFDKRSELLPSMELLAPEEITPFSDEKIHVTARKLEATLAEFGIPARVVGFRVGPTVTQFAVEPGYVERIAPDGQTGRHKVRVSQISALTRDLALALSAERLRIEAPVPGQSFVGIEVPNPRSSIVGLRSILESEEFQKLNAPLGLALGKDVSGRPVVADLSRMPHILIAGTTGSGKSVCISALTACLVMNNTPDQLKLVMLDPKMVELVRFNGLKHILGKVETAPDRMPVVL